MKWHWQINLRFAMFIPKLQPCKQPFDLFTVTHTMGAKGETLSNNKQICASVSRSARTCPTLHYSWVCVRAWVCVFSCNVASVCVWAECSTAVSLPLMCVCSSHHHFMHLYHVAHGDILHLLLLIVQNIQYVVKISQGIDVENDNAVYLAWVNVATRLSAWLRH